MKEMVSEEVPVVGPVFYDIFSKDLEANLNLLLQNFISRFNGVLNNDEEGALIRMVCRSIPFKLSEF